MPSEGTRLRVRSDGTPGNTRVETEDGTLVKGVQVLDWHLEVGGFARLSLDVLAVPADVVGLLDTDVSLPADPEAEPELAVPQEIPEGPGFSDNNNNED